MADDVINTLIYTHCFGHLVHMNALKFGVGRFKGQERTRQMPGSDPFKWPANYDFYDPDVGHVCGHLVGRLWITSSTKAYEEVSY
jgi:hypothetical protein